VNINDLEAEFPFHDISGCWVQSQKRRVKRKGIKKWMLMIVENKKNQSFEKCGACDDSHH
jgi:hypothetical protein